LKRTAVIEDRKSIITHPSVHIIAAPWFLLVLLCNNFMAIVVDFLQY
jgi:hypothetical protein